jgi:predicted ester cyclase
MTKNEQLVRDAMQIIWNECDVSRVNEFYSDNFEADYPHTDWGNGLEGLCNLATQVHRDLPGYTENIDQLIDAGDKIIVILSISGSHPVSGDEISFRDVTVLTIKDDKIVNQRGVGDLLTLYEKLNMITLTSNAQ